MTRLLLVGWDAADWKIIDPLLKAGEMPNLARVLARGVRGNLATQYPPLSPMVWTTIGTGKRPGKHGIHGFTEPTDDGLSVRPISNLGRTTKALWNILNQSGKRSLVVGWWPSHPAEPIDGVMVSNHFQYDHHDRIAKPLPPGAVSPPAWTERLDKLRIHATDVTGSVLHSFVPEWKQVDQKEDRSLYDLAGIIAETASVHAAATELMEHEPWDLAAIYYAGIDHFSHRFMRYHAGKARRRGENGTDPALFKDIVVNAYRYHDAMLGRLLQLAGPDCAVIIVSDHGFHSDELLPDYIPAEAAGPAVEHRDFGIICVAGPGVLKGQTIYGAGVADVTPTALHLFGLPVGRDMDGKVLINAFEKRDMPEPIPSWDEVPGADGRHPPERQYDGLSSVEALNQLVALGYVAPPGADKAKMVRECIAENKYNLARAQMDAARPDLGAELLHELIAGEPEQLRYQQHLFQCLLSLGDLAGCGRMLDAFDEVCGGLAQRALDELKKRRDETSDKDLKPEPGNPDRKELFERQALSEKVGGFVLERLLLRCRLALAESDKPGRKEAARSFLEQLASAPPMRKHLALFLAEGFILIGDGERALQLVRRMRRGDRENWRALALEAHIHQTAGRLQQAVDCAIDSLALVYLQPALHYDLGLMLLKLKETERAEQEFRVALAQAPGLAVAHQQLARLMRRQGKIGEAVLHAAHAKVIRTNAKARQRARKDAAAAAAAAVPKAAVQPPVFERAAGGPPENRARIVTIVTGLPRTGTSMMMQMLAAAGIAPYTDGLREADEDNPRGYLEHASATRLHQDKSWVPEARGKVVKIVAQLLPFLPVGEHYRLVFMHRDLEEVVASQRAMLVRLKRPGARIGDRALMQAYTGQLVRAQSWLERHPDIQVLAVKYADALAHPAETAARLQQFLGAPFDARAAAASVDASLRRQNAHDVRQAS